MTKEIDPLIKQSHEEQTYTEDLTELFPQALQSLETDFSNIFYSVIFC